MGRLLEDVIEGQRTPTCVTAPPVVSSITVAPVPAEDERERSDELRREGLHALFATQCSSQNESILARI